MEPGRLTAEERLAGRCRIVNAYAVLGPSGLAQRCTPIPGEPDHVARDHGSINKIVFRSQAFARNAAREFLSLGEDPQEEYLCARGHWHLRQIARAAGRHHRFGPPLTTEEVTHG